MAGSNMSGPVWGRNDWFVNYGRWTMPSHRQQLNYQCKSRHNMVRWAAEVMQMHIPLAVWHWQPCSNGSGFELYAESISAIHIIRMTARRIQRRNFSEKSLGERSSIIYLGVNEEGRPMLSLFETLSHVLQL